MGMLLHQKLSLLFPQTYQRDRSPCLFYDSRRLEPKKHNQGLFVCYCSRGNNAQRKGHLLLLIGPQDCGKMTLLREVAKVEGKDRFIIIDLRAGLNNSPEGFLCAFQDALATSYLSQHCQPSGFQQAWHNAWQGVTLSLKLQAPIPEGYNTGFKTQKTSQQAHKDFHNVFTKVLKQHAAAPPTIVIDEANKL
ncbi:hypothetical protein GOP47_0004438 [Adiantum capillus-veneris]|uniref:Uncharacterized protein n=1 Tax=Adiantum capillus-veneris TaxID=13818 RepID=A0A9D4V7H1_ADICA|nr:hypothetical protein GOP47_0004438 [Adiantum capillus-veneris]